MIFKCADNLFTRPFLDRNILIFTKSIKQVVLVFD